MGAGYFGETRGVIPVVYRRHAVGIPSSADRSDWSEATAEVEPRKNFAGDVGDPQLLPPIGVAAIARAAVNEDTIVARRSLQEKRRREEVGGIHNGVLPACVDVETIRIGGAVNREICVRVLLRKCDDISNIDSCVRGEFVIDTAD